MKRGGRIKHDPVKAAERALRRQQRREAEGLRPEDIAREARRTAGEAVSLRGNARCLKPKRCVVCDAEFAPHNGIQKYCSRACNRKAQEREFICTNCDKTYRRERATAGRYCSRACANMARFGAGLPVPCLHCGKEFIRTGSRKSRKFCDQSCAMSYRQKNGDLAHMQKWSVKNKGEASCRVCGAPATHLHHIVPRSKAKGGHRDVARNGMPLCRDCHYGWHHRTVEIRQHLMSDAEFAFAVLLAGPLWVEQHYPDDLVVRLLRIDALVNRRDLAGDDLPEPFDLRVEATRHLVADVDPRYAAIRPGESVQSSANREREEA